MKILIVKKNNKKLTDCHREELITYILLLHIQSVRTYQTILTLQIVTVGNLSQIF